MRSCKHGFLDLAAEATALRVDHGVLEITNVILLRFLVKNGDVEFSTHLGLFVVENYIVDLVAIQVTNKWLRFSWQMQHLLIRDKVYLFEIGLLIDHIVVADDGLNDLVVGVVSGLALLALILQLVVHVSVKHFQNSFTLRIKTSNEETETLVAAADLDVADLGAAVGLEADLLLEVVLGRVKYVHDDRRLALVDRNQVREHVGIDISELHKLLVLQSAALVQSDVDFEHALRWLHPEELLVEV